MKSLERRFYDLQPRREGCGPIIIFNAACKNGRFSFRKICYWFNRLIDKTEFEEADRRDILHYAFSLSNPEAGRKRG